MWVSTCFILPCTGIQLFTNDESSLWHIHFCSWSLLQMCCLIFDHFWAPKPNHLGQERVTHAVINWPMLWLRRHQTHHYWFGFNHCMPAHWLYVRSRRRWLNEATTWHNELVLFYRRLFFISHGFFFLLMLKEIYFNACIYQVFRFLIFLFMLASYFFEAKSEFNDSKMSSFSLFENICIHFLIFFANH